jgi:branched-chain amino acid aminotransferase
MGRKIYINGKLVDKDKATVSVFDHGLLYGDGVFEGIRSYGGLVFKLREHIDRLFESAHAITLNMPLTKEGFVRAVISTLKVNKLKDAYIRLVVTRGTGDLGLDPRKCKSPTIIIITDKITLYPEEYYKKGLNIVTVPTQRNVPEALNPQIKSLNYLNNILAKIEAINSNVEEALMLNSLGLVTECTGDNIFIVKNSTLLTPPAYVGILKGITRDAVISIARKKKIVTLEEVLTRHNLYNADEAFLTGTAAEIIPVVKIDGRPIGDGNPGRITRLLMAKFHRITKIDGVRIK